MTVSRKCGPKIATDDGRDDGGLAGNERFKWLMHNDVRRKPSPKILPSTWMIRAGQMRLNHVAQHVNSCF